MLQRPRQARLEKGLLYSCEPMVYRDMGELGSTSTAEVLLASPWMTRGSKTHDRSDHDYDGLVTLSCLDCHKWRVRRSWSHWTYKR